MNPMVLRTLQTGAALIVITVGTLLVLVILGVVGQDSALRIGLNVSAVIGVCMLAGLVLGLLFGAGGGDKLDPK